MIKASTSVKVPFWVPGDWNAFFGLGTNSLLNVLVLSGLLLGVVQLPAEIVFGRIVPAVGVMLFLSNIYYGFMARRLALKENRTDVTAMPAGPSVPHMFIVVLVIMLPVKIATGDAILAWQVGLAWAFIEGLVNLSGAFIAPHFFLNISMACCKAMLDASHGVEDSTLVTAMARNGVEFGVRLSGTGDAWFTAPAPMVDGLYFPGYSQADAAPDLGDSSITETAGLGGFAMGAAPAIVQFVGGTPQDAIAFSREMYYITMGVNSGFTLPALNFAAAPAGIDARKVVDTGIAPVINTGIAHKDAGVGQVGAGITRAPLACFEQAIRAFKLPSF